MDILLIVSIIILVIIVYLIALQYTNEDKYDDLIYDIWNSYPIRKPREIYYDIKHGIENLYHYLPIIWNNREWDEHYIFVLLNKKFERMEKLHREHGHLVRSPRTAKQLMIVKNLTKRLISHEYLMNALQEYHKKYGDGNIFDSEPVEGKPQFRRLVDKRPKNQQEEWTKASKHSDKMEKQDFEMLMFMMKKYMYEWWD